MIVLVTGGRKYKYKAKVFAALDEILSTQHPRDYDITIVQGGCKTGVDSFVREWCVDNEVDCVNAPARWKKLGPKAGPIRNTRMLSIYNPEKGLVFPGGAGTEDCASKMEKAKIPFRRIA